MRQRMEYEARRKKIIEGALCVFSVKGFAEASNRDIAQAAGLRSPGLIYHYFSSKSELLMAVVQEFSPPLRLLEHADRLLDQPPRETLTEVARAYESLYTRPVSLALMRVVIGEALRNPDFVEVFVKLGPGNVLTFLSGYLERQMAVGVLRRRDPALAARSFMGPLIAIALGKLILGIELPSQAPPEAVIAEVVDTFLTGMAPL